MRTITGCLLALTLAGCLSEPSTPVDPDPTPAEPHPASVFDVLTTDAIDWETHRSRELLYPHFPLAVCDDHFPPGSAARAEVEQAVSWFNAIAGADLSIEVVNTPHLTESELFATDLDCDASTAYFDYVWEEFPCHARDEDGWTDAFSLNACSYYRVGGWGAGSLGACTFNVSVNAHRRDHADDPAAIDFPRAANIAHELGHGFGQRHTGSWPEDDQVLISTMQGNLPGLSAYDTAFVRGFHPGAPAEGPIQLVPSPLSRQGAPGDWTKVFFGAEHIPTTRDFPTNPQWVYAEGDQILDCATDAPPVFALTAFNLSADHTGDGTSPVPLDADLTLTSREGETVLLVSLPLGEVDPESQVQWEGAVEFPPSVAGWSTVLPHTLRFALNARGREGVEQNGIDAELFIVPTPAACP